MPKNIELLAPAKNLETAIEAFRHGADAVYIGGPSFGARAAAGNSIVDIRQICDYAHIFGARVYVTLNTIIYDEELQEVESLIKQLDEAGVDALITQDLALLSLDIPPIALHASTQMDNCTPEKFKFLERAGYSQAVLARELGLEQIKAIHDATDIPLEAFVHGALCVSFSGRCYASEYCFSRSANRGRCAQFCRLAFDLVDADGHILSQGRHLLSLRDMNRSAHVEEMMDAGVTSFKIEGRLKDVAYVKNVTAYYRSVIDDIISRRPDDFCRSSRGIHDYTFTPDPDRSFNRGYTTYFLHGRTNDVFSFNTPKSIGQPVGEVRRVGKKNLEIFSDVPLHNGDGLTFFDANERLVGFRANRVEGHIVYPFTMPQITAGTRLFRNEDREWENLLSRQSATRKLPVVIKIAEASGSGGYELTMCTDGHSATVFFPTQVQTALRSQDDNIIRNLSKLGDTPFVATEVRIDTSEPRFIPASLLAEMRRQLVAAFTSTLQSQHLANRDRRKASMPIDLKGVNLPYSANVANHCAKNWLLSHGATAVEPAYELEHQKDAVLMTCKHCIRYAMGWCTRQNQKSQPKGPLALRLPDGRTFPLRFDCKRCEMQVLSPQ